MGSGKQPLRALNLMVFGEFLLLGPSTSLLPPSPPEQTHRHKRKLIRMAGPEGLGGFPGLPTWLVRGRNSWPCAEQTAPLWFRAPSPQHQCCRSTRVHLGEGRPLSRSLPLPGSPWSPSARSCWRVLACGSPRLSRSTRAPQPTATGPPQPQVSALCPFPAAPPSPPHSRPPPRSSQGPPGASLAEGEEGGRLACVRGEG